MNVSGTTLNCNYFDGEHPVSQPAMIHVADHELVITTDTLIRSYNFTDIKLSPRIARADRFISFVDGSQCQCPDHRRLDVLPQEVKSEGIVAWLESNIAVAVASIGVIILALVLGYFYGLPAVAGSIAKRIPISSESAMGKNVLKWFDNRQWFTDSEIGASYRNELRRRFYEFYKNHAMADYIDLEFRNSAVVGPNAFALPGGTIVITDQLVDVSQSQEEVLAVLAHELGHVDQRHSMRLVLQSSFAALLASAVTSDAASLSVAVVGVPALLVQKSYSRDFERAADAYAFEMLKRQGISPTAFADIMERIDKQNKETKALSILSTHPVTEDRVKRARKSSKLSNKEF